MKKVIALGVALVTLLLCFAPAVTVAAAPIKVYMCEDIEPHQEPYD